VSIHTFLDLKKALARCVAHMQEIKTR